MTPIAVMRAPLRMTSLAFLLAASSCAPAGSGPASLPPTGTAVFGPQGLLGVVAGRSGGTAIINPTGGGPPAILVPNSNGTATIVQPGGPSQVVPNPTR